jgi:hypothetical protein
MCGAGLLMGGTYDKAPGLGGSVLVRRLRAAGTCRVFWVGACTLLGPEGPGADLFGGW